MAHPAQPQSHDPQRTTTYYDLLRILLLLLRKPKLQANTKVSVYSGVNIHVMSYHRPLPQDICAWKMQPKPILKLNGLRGRHGQC
jgi:hypothetical protein